METLLDFMTFVFGISIILLSEFVVYKLLMFIIFSVLYFNSLFLPFMYKLDMLIVFSVFYMSTYLILPFLYNYFICSIFTVFDTFKFLILLLSWLKFLTSLLLCKLIMMVNFSVLRIVNHLISAGKLIKFITLSGFNLVKNQISPFLYNQIKLIVFSVLDMFYDQISPLLYGRIMHLVSSVSNVLSFLIARLSELVVNQSSAPSSQSDVVVNQGIYDVFLSFRGEVRDKFVGHLYTAFEQKGIYCFKDDRRLQKGEVIESELYKAIQESSYAVVILSEDYASSKWCLRELAKIMECKNEMGQIVLPVFYHVDPRDVRNQRGTFGQAFAKHKTAENVNVWKEALKKAGGLSGWHVDQDASRNEAKCIEEIVARICRGINNKASKAVRNAIGIERRISRVESLLETGSGDVKVIGICGPEGAGKTTVARAVFYKISHHFDGKSFVKNVKELSSRKGLADLQRTVLSDVLIEKNNEFKHSDYEMMISTRLRQKNVLLVLDDVDDEKQLRAVAEDRNWFGNGSRIVMVTTEKQLLLGFGVKEEHIYDVELLNEDEAFQLLIRHAVKNGTPPEEFKDVSLGVVRCAAGFPSALKRLGSYLHDKPMDEWIRVLAVLSHAQKTEMAANIARKIPYQGLW